MILQVQVMLTLSLQTYDLLFHYRCVLVSSQNKKRNISHLQRSFSFYKAHALTTFKSFNSLHQVCDNFCKYPQLLKKELCEPSRKRATSLPQH